MAAVPFPPDANVGYVIPQPGYMPNRLARPWSVICKKHILKDLNDRALTERESSFVSYKIPTKKVYSNDLTFFYVIHFKQTIT